MPTSLSNERSKQARIRLAYTCKYFLCIDAIFKFITKVVNISWGRLWNLAKLVVSRTIYDIHTAVI